MKKSNLGGSSALTQEEKEKVFVRKVLDSFIEDVCLSRLDVSVDFKSLEVRPGFFSSFSMKRKIEVVELILFGFQQKAKGKGAKKVTLPPHPQNVANEKKLNEVKGHFATYVSFLKATF